MVLVRVLGVWIRLRVWIKVLVLKVWIRVKVWVRFGFKF
jgi:hypothetical protein